MLLEFRIENFRSIKDEQCLSFVASDDTEKMELNCIATGNTEIPYVVGSAAIYGPNASGKSNLTLALMSMQALVLRSTQFLETDFIRHYTPFKLDTISSNKPISFEVTIIANGVCYQYGFAYDGERVHREWLLVNKDEQWFERNGEEWVFSEQFEENDVTLRDTWKRATRPNALFLTTAVQLNCEQLKPLYHWFERKLIIIPAFRVDGCNPSVIQNLDNPGYKQKMLGLLKSADIHIDDIRKTERSSFVDIEFAHKSKDGTIIWFDRRFESLGTQRLLDYGVFFFDVFEAGKLVVIDEIENSLHPMLVAYILRQFHNPALNKNAAQLWMITHNVNLLSPEMDLFRKDQIWFIQKDREQASKLYPLTDFEARENENLERDYLRGRYGALPFIKD